MRMECLWLDDGHGGWNLPVGPVELHVSLVSGTDPKRWQGYIHLGYAQMRVGETNSYPADIARALLLAMDLLGHAADAYHVFYAAEMDDNHHAPSNNPMG